MNERITCRLILLDPDNRILLMKIRGEWGNDTGKPIWITLGGGLEEGESVMDAAIREAWEESGIEDIEIGPAVAYIETMGWLNKQPCLFRETFVAAHAPTAETRQDNWTEIERKVVAELRWWTLDELRATDEIVLPTMLVDLLPDVIAGRYPEEMLRITL